MPAKILIVDDEPPIIDLLTYNLKQANFNIVVARDGQEALAKTRLEQPDLIILDLMLPVLDGLEVCRILRREHQIPIIMLTARGAEVDRVVGLEIGADDYIVKPFSVRELVARVKNVLRRAAPSLPGDLIQVGKLTIDPACRTAILAQSPLELTSLEFDLLHHLAQYPGQVFSRERLLEQVWGYDFPGDLRVVDAAIKRLRKKTRLAAPASDLIETVRGVGYKLNKDED